MKSQGKANPGKLVSHFSSIRHKDCLDALVALKAKSFMLTAYSTNAKEKKRFGRQKKIKENTKQLKGAASEKEGNGNFHQITSFVARHLPEDVTNTARKEVNQSQVATVIADTTPDASHVDQLSVVARYMHPSGNMQERLVDMTDIDKKTGDGQAKQIMASWNKESYIFAVSLVSPTTLQHLCLKDVKQ
eukprot:gene16280-17918_t